MRVTGRRECLLICGLKATSAAKQNGFSDRYGNWPRAAASWQTDATEIALAEWIKPSSDNSNRNL